MLVVDTGPILAAADQDAPRHAECLNLLATAAEPLVVPMLVVAEAGYLINREMGSGAELAFVRSLEAGHVIAEPVAPQDWSRVAELLHSYRDLDLGVTDASVVATCERLGEVKLATLDHRDFAPVRPRHCPALELVPA